MIEKVTNPGKIVTDPVLLKDLAEWGIDKDYVEFYQDYAPRSLGKEHSSYAKFYRDLKSNKRFMVVSGLPMVKPDGTKIEVGWFYKKGKYYSKPNLFSAVIEGTKITVTCLGDQPDGRKKGDWAEWHPQVFLDGVEQSCGNPLYLDTDPINANYHFNTIEWNFGFCKRRARTIPGKFRDRIFLTSDPHREIEVRNNVTGNMRLKFGSRDADGNPIGRVIGDVEIISKEELAKAEYPITIGASPETFNPDPHVETSSVDGKVAETTDAVWATIRVASGDSSNDTDTWMQFGMQSVPPEPTWGQLNRMIIVLYTEGLPDNALVSGVTFGMYGVSKVNNIGTSPNINIYKTAPAGSPGHPYVALVAGDFDSFTLNQDLATAIAWADLNIGTPGTINTWTLIDVDTDDFGYINRTGATLLGATNQTYDADGATPPWAENQWDTARFHTAEAGAGYKPKLVVTYSLFIPPVADGDLIGIPIIRKS